MGPLVPYIISNEFSLIVALLLGFGFGFVLEQAGFSSTKKLVGLFYGYDFTVLKVFFTAGVTAMIGVLLLAHWGLLDLSMIYINPTFLWSALVGGAIMGAGFIIGGFCPGTSICAASIGKLDGIAFVFGSVLGVLIFAEGYPVFQNIYLAQDWGAVLINEQLGMSRNLFAFVLTAIAIAAFYFTGKIENKVNKIKEEKNTKKTIHYTLAGVTAFLLLTLIVVTPDKNEALQNKITELRQQTTHYNEVPADSLASEIVYNFSKINIIDVRSAEDFKTYHLPLSINIPFEEMTNRKWQTVLKQHNKSNYFYADTDSLAQKAYILANIIGKADNYILKESANEFEQMYSVKDSTELAMQAKSKILKYRQDLAIQMAALAKIFGKMDQPVVQKEVKVKGGCS